MAMEKKTNRNKLADTKYGSVYPNDSEETYVVDADEVEANEHAVDYHKPPKTKLIRASEELPQIRKVPRPTDEALKREYERGRIEGVNSAMPLPLNIVPMPGMIILTRLDGTIHFNTGDEGGMHDFIKDMNHVDRAMLASHISKIAKFIAFYEEMNNGK